MEGSGLCTVLSNDAYKAALDGFYQHSPHPRHAANFVISRILPLLGPPSRLYTLLDVGGGPGTISRLLSRHFLVHLLDANSDYYHRDEGAATPYVLKKPPPCSCGRPDCVAVLDPGCESNIQVQVGEFLSSPLPQQQFDVVLASHVLYQMPPAVLERMLTKMLGCTAPGGFLLVMHSADRGVYEFTSGLEPGVVSSKTIVEALARLGVQCEVFPQPSPVEFERVEELEAVLQFIALESCCTPGAQAPSHERIRAAIQRFLPTLPRTPQGGYVLPEESDFILVRKMAS